MARTQNGLDYSVLIKMSEFHGLKNIDDLLFLAGEIDSEIYIKSQSKK